MRRGSEFWLRVHCRVCAQSGHGASSIPKLSCLAIIAFQDYGHSQMSAFSFGWDSEARSSPSVWRADGWHAGPR